MNFKTKTEHGMRKATVKRILCLKTFSRLFSFRREVVVVKRYAGYIHASRRIFMPLCFFAHFLLQMKKKVTADFIYLPLCLDDLVLLPSERVAKELASFILDFLSIFK